MVCQPMIGRSSLAWLLACSLAIAQQPSSKKTDSADAEFLLLTLPEQQAVIAIREHLRTNGFDGLSVESIRFAYSGNGSLFLRDDVLAAVKIPCTHLGTLPRLVPMTPKEQVDAYLRYKPSQMSAQIQMINRIFDTARPLDDELKNSARQFPMAMRRLRMRIKGQGPFDPAAVDTNPDSPSTGPPSTGPSQIQYQIDSLAASNNSLLEALATAEAKLKKIAAARTPGTAAGRAKQAAAKQAASAAVRDIEQRIAANDKNRERLEREQSQQSATVDHH